MTPQGRTARREVLRALKIPISAQSDHAGCPGLTSPFPDSAEIRATCPTLDQIVARVGPLEEGSIPPALKPVWDTVTPKQNVEYTIVVNVLELGPEGSSGESFHYVFRFEGTRAVLVRREGTSMRWISRSRSILNEPHDLTQAATATTMPLHQFPPSPAYPCALMT